MTVAPGAPPGAPNLLALKILVVVMGIAIVAGVIVIVVAVSNRLSESETAAQAGAAGAMAPGALSGTEAASAAMGDLSIAVPDGCVMADAGIEGNRLIVRLDGLAERGCQQIILIDLTSGTVVGRVTAEPGP